MDEYSIMHGNNLVGFRRTGTRREVGKVIALRDDLAEVLFPRGRQCEGCGSCCVMAGEDSMVAEAYNPVGAKVGDRVEVELPVGVSIKAAYLLYGVPLVAFLVGLGAGALLGSYLLGSGFSIPLGLVFGFGFLALSYVLLARVYSPQSRASAAFRPAITRVVDRVTGEG